MPLYIDNNQLFSFFYGKSYWKRIVFIFDSQNKILYWLLHLPVAYVYDALIVKKNNIHNYR